MLKVRDIMTRDVITLRPDMTLEEASGVFAQKHVSGAPVVANTEVVGVVSQSDLLEFVTAASTAGEPRGIDVRAPEEESERRPLPTWEEEGTAPASFFSQRWTERDESSAEQLIESEALGETAGYEVTPLAAHTVDEVMSRAIHAVHPGAEVVTVADYMRRVGIHRVLVMDGKKLLGILTSLDVAAAVADHRLERRVYVFGPRADDRGAGDAG